MKMPKKAIFLVLSGLFVLPLMMAPAFAAAACGSENTMECSDENAGCKHRTCQGSGDWGSWIQFDDDNYECTTAPYGGQKCSWKGGTILSIMGLDSLEENQLLEILLLT